MVAAIVVDASGRVLATRRAHGSWAGYWEFPGGKIHCMESAEAAMQRELWEELRVESRVGPPLLTAFHPQWPLQIAVSAYRVELLTGEMQLSDHDDFCWCDLAELSALRLLPADRVIVEYLKQQYP